MIEKFGYKFKEKLKRRYSIGERIASSITQGIGVLLSIAALVLLVVFSAQTGDAWRVATFSVYGAILIIIYLASTMYHSLSYSKAKSFLKKIDNMSFYLLIAGTYTPITLTVLRGPWGWTIFGILWFIAVLGIIKEMFFLSKHKIIAIIIYVTLSSLIIITLKPLIDNVPKGMLIWLILGGTCYLLGLIFYRLKKVRFSNVIWNLFVLAGSILHFFGMMFNIAM